MQDDKKLSLEVFSETTLSDLFKQIYTSTRQNKKEMKKHLQKVSEKMDNISNIAIYSGLLIQYMKTVIKNDEQLLKMTDIITSLINKTAKSQDVESVNEIKISQQQKRKILDGLNQEVEDLIKNKHLKRG